MCENRLPNAVSAAICCGMTGEELIQFRARMGWGRAELARRLEISPSRLADFERGCSRGKNSRPAQIPKVVELACRWLAEYEGRQRRLTPAERAKLWRDDSLWPQVDHTVDDNRDGIYGDLPGGRQP
jgi:DNA-binding XRE family transcriptional regulator